MIRSPDPNTLRPSPTLIMDRRVHTRRLLWVIFDRSSRFRLTDHVNFALKADVGCRVYDGVDAPRRHRCAKVEVLSTT